MDPGGVSVITEGFDLWRQCRAEFEGELWRRYALAEHDTHGALLNQLGRERNVDPASLFMGPARRAYLYASEELVDHWTRHPRMPYAEFERQWMASLTEAERIEDRDDSA